LLISSIFRFIELIVLIELIGIIELIELIVLIELTVLIELFVLIGSIELFDHIGLTGNHQPLPESVPVAAKHQKFRSFGGARRF